MTEQKKCLPAAAYQPAGMLFASSLNFFGAIASLIAIPSSRNNPFFYTAMVTSGIYMASNIIKVAQELSKDRQKTWQEKETSRQELSVLEEGLNKYYGR
jgi:membrane carboxypeptidase/penicillin-binding protein